MRAAWSRGSRAATALALVLAAFVLAGCAVVVPGQAAPAPGGMPPPLAAPAPPDPEMARLPTDQVSAAAIVALQDFWRATFPVAFGRQWGDIRIFAPVSPGDPDAPTPPCVSRAAELAGQAFYCPAADAVVWDADGLLPDLRERFGPVGVVVVLAHEIGHAVQTRLGVDDAQARDPQRYPTILLEAMADCYAGVALRHLVEGGSAEVPLSMAERDQALLALVGFRDPIGVLAEDDDAHGNAFDRVSAFQDGYADGAVRCAEMSLETREFTQRQFASAEDFRRGGDLPLTELLTAIESDAQAWFRAEAAQRGADSQAPSLVTGPTGACPRPELTAQGPVRFCAADGSIAVDRTQMAPLHRELGDYAGGTLVAARYGLALLETVGAPVVGTRAGNAAVCLAGAYTARLVEPADGFGLSPGDLDEAVQVLLVGDWAARDARGTVDPDEYGFERVQRFTTGVLGGPAGCGLPT
jgi:predicted metalloprotease